MPSQAETRDEAPLIIGVDGGGSRCTAVLARATSSGVQEIGRGQGGPANAVAIGFERAAAHVATAVESAWASAGLPASPARAACLGLAGAGRSDMAQRWLTWSRGAIADEAEVMPDGLPAFDSGDAPAWGLLVIAGTGSIVWGRRPEGPPERCGGRGSVAGDEGSGLWVATEGLRAVFRVADGWGNDTTLLQRALNRFKATEINELATNITAPATSRSELAGFATDVVAAAAAGDAVSRGILANAADVLARQAAALARRLEIPDQGFPLRLCGGLLYHATPVREALVTALVAAGLEPAAVITVPDLAMAALVRAIRLARKAQRGS